MERTHSFGYWLKRRRKALDLTQAELAQRVSCSINLIQKIETDARRPSKQLAERLAGSLGLDGAEQAAFVQAARAERVVDQLAVAAQPLEQPQRSSHTNLPAQLTTLFGRETEVAAICKLLRRANARLVTLTGPGGVGKTRLSLQVAAELSDEFADGVYFVDLAPVRDPSFVTSAIAAALGVRESAGRPLLESLKGYLGDKRMLLLLDNFEQVADAAPVVAELLGAAAQLKVLVTSREVLRLRGEKEIVVPPLALPDPAQLPPFEQLSQYAAVALFIERAQDARPEFEVTNANAPAVAEICARLDGLPLAIELAAARLKLFAPEALLARLSSRLALLTSGPRDLPERQQTIRDTIAWSYDLLSEHEQTLFRRLGVFVGGWTMEAAEAVCALANDPPLDVLVGVAALVDKSLLRQVAATASDTRFGLLETMHEYALEQLNANDERAKIQKLHAAYYLALAERVDEPGAAASHYLGQELETEHANLLAALQWALDDGESDVLVRLAGALGGFWTSQAHLIEGRIWLTRAIERSCAVAAPARAKVLYNAGELAWIQGDLLAARGPLEQSLALYQELGDSRAMVAVLNGLGFLAWGMGDYDQAVTQFEAGLRLSTGLGDHRNSAWMLLGLGYVARNQRDYIQAGVLFDEALMLFQNQGAAADSGHALTALGHLARSQGDDAQAAVYYDESLAIAREAGAKYEVAAILHNQAYLALRQGNHERAKALLLDVLPMSLYSGDQGHLAYVMAAFGGVAVAQGRLQQAVRLLAAAQTWFDRAPFVIAPTEQEEHDGYLEAARAQLGEEAFADAWGAGRAMTVEQALADGLEGGAVEDEATRKSAR